MAKFIYSGPVQSLSLASGTEKGPDGASVSKFVDVVLTPGAEVELDGENPIVAGMIDQGVLAPAPVKSTSKPNAKGDAK